LEVLEEGYWLTWSFFILDIAKIYFLLLIVDPILDHYGCSANQDNETLLADQYIFIKFVPDTFISNNELKAACRSRNSRKLYCFGIFSELILCQFFCLSSRKNIFGTFTLYMCF